MSDSCLTQAKEFAILNHENLFRSGKSQEPQVVHLSEVASLTSLITQDPIIISAAWLHDVVEDTDVCIDEIQHLFGDRLGMLVDGLTDPEGFEILPLAERKTKQTERLKYLHDDVKLVKICDQLANIKAVYFDPPLSWDDDFSWLYMSKAAEVASVCSGISTFFDDQIEHYLNLGREKYKP